MAAPHVRDITSRHSLGELLSELTDGSAELVRDEIRLARAETLESLGGLRRGTIILGVGAAFALCAAAAAVACAIMVISQYLLDDRTWLAALIVAAVLAVIAGLCVARGAKELSPSRIAPHDTTESIKETAVWLKHPTRSAGR